MRTNSSRWCGPRMDESRVRYSKLSMITATKRLSIWKKRRMWAADRKSAENHKQLHKPTDCSCADQEGAEEDERDKVAVGKVGATASFVVRRHGEGGDGGVWLTFLTRQTWKHNLLPGLPRGAPRRGWTRCSLLISYQNHPKNNEKKLNAVEPTWRAASVRWKRS